MAKVETPTQIDVSKYIEIRLFEDRPHIRGRRIPVAIVVLRVQQNNMTNGEAAYDFGISEAEVLAALLYYQEHKAMIDAQIEEETVAFNEMKRLHGQR
jgi:uncharacterized protein (DUF433 family)